MATRGLGAALTNPFRGVRPQPVVFLQLATGIAATPTLRYTDAPMTLSWLSSTWTRRPLEMPTLRFEQQGEAGGLAIKIGDVDRELATLIESAPGLAFRDQRAIVYLTDATIVAAGTTEAIQETLVCEGYERGEGYVVLNLRALFAAAAAALTPLRRMTRTLFPGIPPNL